MPSHDLSSIQGLEDKHLRALARHQVTDLRGLVQADREVIYRAMANLRPRPTRDQIACWQEEAGSMLAETMPDAPGETASDAPGETAPDAPGETASDAPGEIASDAPGETASDAPGETASDAPGETASDAPGETAPDASQWQTAASFVVVFSQRQAGGTWERRVEAERTEVEPERNPQVWSGWECEPVCGWMLGQLGRDDRIEPVPAEPLPAEPLPAEPLPAEPLPAEPVSERPALRIDSATIIDATGRADVLTAGAVAARPRSELVAPVRVVFTVSGARPQTRLQAVTRILRRDGPGWNAQDPVAVPGSGQAEFDLSRVPAGEHEMSLIAWAPDAAAKPASVRLPQVTIRPN